MFDFIFYKLYLFYEKKEKGNDSVWTAALYVSILQFLMLYSIVIFIDIFSNKVLLNDLTNNKIIVIIISLTILILLFLFNCHRYRKLHSSIVSKYKNRPTNQWFKIWMIGALMMILLLSPILWNELHKLIIK